MDIYLYGRRMTRTYEYEQGYICGLKGNNENPYRKDSISSERWRLGHGAGCTHLYS